MTPWLERLQTEGYALLPEVFSGTDVACMRFGCAEALARPEAGEAILASPGESAHGARNLLDLWPQTIEIACSPPLVSVITTALGPTACLVRGLYFDKPRGNGWALPWHRDTAIAVRSHVRGGRFRKPTVKAGVPHVEAPPEVLVGLLMARIHLDDMTDRNGPLQLLPGTHDLSGNPDESRAITLNCRSGDVLLMRPLLLHASCLCSPGHEGHRRIVQLEFAPSPDLPDGYQWHSCHPLHARG